MPFLHVMLVGLLLEEIDAPVFAVDEKHHGPCGQIVDTQRVGQMLAEPVLDARAAPRSGPRPQHQTAVAAARALVEERIAEIPGTIFAPRIERQTLLHKHPLAVSVHPQAAVLQQLPPVGSQIGEGDIALPVAPFLEIVARAVGEMRVVIPSRDEQTRVVVEETQRIGAQRHHRQTDTASQQAVYQVCVCRHRRAAVSIGVIQCRPHHDDALHPLGLEPALFRHRRHAVDARARIALGGETYRLTVLCVAFRRCVAIEGIVYGERGISRDLLHRQAEGVGIEAALVREDHRLPPRREHRSQQQHNIYPECTHAKTIPLW